MTSRDHNHWVVCLICVTSLAGCVSPTPNDDGAGDTDSSGDGDGDPSGDGDGDPGDGDADPTGDGDDDPTGDGDDEPGDGDGDPAEDGVPYRDVGVLWNEVGRIKLALYDSESGWDETTDVNPPEHHAIDTALFASGAIADTGVMVLWDHYIAGHTPVFARRYVQDSGWESPVELDPSTPFSLTRGVFALTDGQTLAVWRQTQTLDNGTYTVAYACRDDEGHWSAVVPSDNPNIQIQRRQDGTLVVLDVDILAPQIEARVFNPGGGGEWCSQPLGDPTPLNPTIGDIRSVPVQDQGGPLIHAVWRAESTKHVETAHFDPETLAWSAPTLLPSMVNYPVGQTGDTILGSEDGDGNAFVVTNDVSTANMRLRVHRFDAELGTWSDTILLDQPDHELYFPGLAVSPGGQAFVAAQIEPTGMDERAIVGFAWNDADQTWSEPIDLGTTNENYSDTLVEVGPESGDVFVTWTHDNDVHLMHFDAQAQTWSERVFPTALELHSARYLRAMEHGQVLLVLEDTTLDFPDSIGTLTALVYGAGVWSPEHVLASNANVGQVRPFMAQY